MNQQITIKQVAGGYTVAYTDKSGKRQEVLKPNKLWGRYSYNQRNSGDAAYRTFKDKKC